MGQNLLDARSAWGSLRARVKGTFTRRSTPLTVVDLLGPARAARQFDPPQAGRRLHPRVPRSRRALDGSGVVQCATPGGSPWAGGR